MTTCALRPGDVVMVKVGGSFERCHDGQVAEFTVVDDDGEIVIRCKCGDEFDPKTYSPHGDHSFVRPKSSERRGTE